MNKDEALKLALEFLEQLGENHWGNRPDVIATIKEALAQPEPKYVAFMDVPYRKWVGLTTEEILGLQDFAYADDIEFVNHIEALLKEKNT